MNKQKKKLSMRGFTIYLVLLLVAVLVYLFVFVPRFKTEADTLSSQQASVQAEISALEVYEAQPDLLQQQIDTCYNNYNADTRLVQAVRFADELFSAADANGCRLQDVSISAGGDTQPSTSQRVYTASIILGVPAGGSPAGFFATLEAREGVGFYVTSCNYAPNTQEEIPVNATIQMVTETK